MYSKLTKSLRLLLFPLTYFYSPISKIHTQQSSPSLSSYLSTSSKLTKDSPVLFPSLFFYLSFPPGVIKKTTNYFSSSSFISSLSLSLFLTH